MPQQREHLEKAENNERLALALKAKVSFCADWAITMLFYAALHYIDAYLAGKDMHPLSHDQRDDEVDRNGSITDIYRHYRRLKDMSRAARYEIVNFTPENVETAKRRLEAVKTHLFG